MTDDDRGDAFAGTDPDPVPDGGILTVRLHDPGRASQVVTVTATDGDDATESRTLEVKLRGNGKGSAQLIVPVGWGSVVLACEGCGERRVGIALPP